MQVPKDPSAFVVGMMAIAKTQPDMPVGAAYDMAVAFSNTAYLPDVQDDHDCTDDCNDDLADVPVPQDYPDTDNPLRLVSYNKGATHAKNPWVAWHSHYPDGSPGNTWDPVLRIGSYPTRAAAMWADPRPHLRGRGPDNVYVPKSKKASTV